MNIANWFDTPNTWDLNELNQMLMANSDAQILIYQNGQNVDLDGSGVKSRIGFHAANGVEFGANYSYDKTFESRVSADAVIRFGGPSSTSKSKKQWHAPVIEALSSSPKNRDVRVADPCTSFQLHCVDPIAKHLVHRVERRINRLKFH